MKKTTKIIFKILNFAMIFMLFSCEKDLYEDKIYQNEIVKKKITLKEFKNYRKSFSNFEKIVQSNEIARTKKRNSTGKLVYDENYGFYIDTDNILYMEKGGYKSFTIPVFRDEVSEKMENLILSSKIDESQFKIYLAKYDLTETEKSMIDNNITVPNIVSKTDIETLNGENLIINGVVSKHIYVDEDGNCYEIDRIINIGGGMVEITYIQVDCGSAGGGGGDTGSGAGSGSGSGSSGNSDGSNGNEGGGTEGGAEPSGGGGGGGGGGSGGGVGSEFSATQNAVTNNNSNSQIITTPIHGTPQINHLTKLQALSRIPNTGQPQNVIRNTMIVYKSQLTSAIQENGVEFRRGPVTNGASSYYSINPTSLSYNETHFGPPVINTSVYIHYHPANEITLPNGKVKAISVVPSDSDFEGFAANFNLMGPNSNRNDLTSITVTKKGFYAMRAGNPNQVLAFQQYLSDNRQRKDFEVRFEKNVIVKAQTKATEKFNAQGAGTEAQFQELVDQETEKWLVRFIHDFNTNILNIGILLFHADIIQGVITWTELATTPEP